MTWFHWVLVALFALSSIGRILLIGKERKPITPGQAAVGVLVDGLFIIGIIHYL